MLLLEENAKILTVMERGSDLGPRARWISRKFPDHGSAEAFGNERRKSGLKIDLAKPEHDEDP